MNSPLFAVYGASGCGRGIMPLAREQLRRQGVAQERLVFVDDGAVDASMNGQRVLSYADFVAAPAGERHVVLAIANSAVRERLAARCAADGVRAWTVAAANVVVLVGLFAQELKTPMPVSVKRLQKIWDSRPR